MALSPMFSPTHMTYTGEPIQVICQSEAIDPLYTGIMVTFRSATMGIWTVSKETFEGYVPSREDQMLNVRRYAPIVGA